MRNRCDEYLGVSAVGPEKRTETSPEIHEIISRWLKESQRKKRSNTSTVYNDYNAKSRYRKQKKPRNCVIYFNWCGRRPQNSRK